MTSSVSGRIEAIEIKNPELAGHLKIAKKTLSSDPHTALTKCRIALGKILFQVYVRELGKKPTRNMIGNLLADKELIPKIPHRIRARMNLIREIGNLGPHGGETTREDTILVFKEALYITEWFITTYDIFILQESVKGSSLEMLPQLLAKYKNKIRPEVTSVKFIQTKDRCSLEVMTIKEIAGYLKDEMITRTDLGFIADDDYDDLFFDPRNNIEKNAIRFVNEFDEYSIYMCTELFTDEVGKSINNDLIKKSETS